MEEEDPFDYEEQDVSRIIRPSIHEMVDNIQWLDQVQEKQQKELEKEIRAKQARTAHGEFTSAERCLICTLAMGTCEHTRAWTLQHQEELFLKQQEENERLFRSENELESELKETLDKDVLSHDNTTSQHSSGNDEIALEHMAWLPLEERAVDKIDSEDAKLSSPNDRIWHSSVLLDGFLVVFGGLKTIEGRNPLLDSTVELVYLNDMKAYDLSTQAWKTIHISQTSGSIPAARYGHGAAAITKDSFIVFGGRGVRGKIFNDTWLFDLRHGCWQCLDESIQQTSFASPSDRFFTACCSDIEVTLTSEAEDAGEEAEVAEDKCSPYMRQYVLNNRSRRSVYLFGGTNGNDNFNDLWRFRLHYKEEDTQESSSQILATDDNADINDDEKSELESDEQKEQYYDPDEIEANVKLDEQLTVTERLTLLLQRTEPLTKSTSDSNSPEKARLRHNKTRKKNRKQMKLTLMGHWERCVATGDTPVARYGHSLCLLTRPIQPPGVKNVLDKNNRHVYINKKQSDDTEEERFILVLGGCHVSPEREVSVGSEASAQDTAILLSLATRLQQAYAQENLTSVLATHQLRNLLIQEIAGVSTQTDNSNMTLGRDTAEALTHWLQQAGNVSRLLALRERDTRVAEQLLVDAFKIYKATLKWQMTGRHMTNAARHSETHLDIHWLRLPAPLSAARVSRHASSIKKSCDFESEDGDTRAVSCDTQEGDTVYLQWEVSQHGRVMGLCGSGKYRPSARMHFGACVLRHQQEARFLLVVGGIEPTSLTFLAPATPATPSLGETGSTVSRHTAPVPKPSQHKRELSVFVLDLRTMVWTLPSAVNAFHYKEQTLAIAKAEYLRAKHHLQSLEITAMSLLGRSKHYLAATTSQHNKTNANLDDILEIRQARVFQEVCRWRLHTLQQSLNSRHIKNKPRDTDNFSVLTEESFHDSHSNNNSNNNPFQFVPGKKIVSLLDSKAKRHKATHAQHNRDTPATVASDTHNSVPGHSFDDRDTVQHRDLFEGYGGFAATRLGQRLVLVGGVHFPADVNPTLTDTTVGDTLSRDTLTEDGTLVSHSVASVSETRLKRALCPPCVMVLDMEALSVKQTRWQRNYYASLELYRKQEEAKLQMDALISLHAIREAQRIETETLLRENRFMSIEDYLSHIPPLSRPGVVSLFDQRRSVHSIWVVWEDLVQVAKKTMKRRRATQTRHRNMFFHDTNGQTSFATRAKRSFSLEMDIATATQLLKRLRSSNFNNNTGNFNNQAAKSKINPDYFNKSVVVNSGAATQRDDESETDFSSVSSSAANLTYFLYAQIGFENLQPGDTVDVLPKEVKRPSISKRPFFVNDTTGDLEDSATHCYDDCDLFFDDTTPRHRGVLLKPSVFSAKPGYFTVKYTDKSLETQVSRHRIRRVSSASFENETDKNGTHSTTIRDDSSVNNHNNNFQLNFNNISSLSTGDTVNRNNQSETVSSLNPKNPNIIKDTDKLPTVLPDPRIWTLVYAGPETQYAVTHLLPRHIQETETHLKVGVMFCVQTHGMDSPQYERSQLSHPVIIHTLPATHHDTLQTTCFDPSFTETQYVGSADSVVSQVSQASGTHHNGNDDTVTHSQSQAGHTQAGTMSRTKKQVISAVIQARHLCPAESLPVTQQDTDDTAGLYKTRRIALVEPAPAPTDLLATHDTSATHPVPPYLATVSLDPSTLAVDERHETVETLAVTLATQDNYVWGEGRGDDYA